MNGNNKKQPIVATIAKSDINHPPRYNTGKTECIDIIREMSSKDEFAGFCKGNVLKYLYRYKSKDGVKDIQKAKWYLEKLEEIENG